MHGQVPCQAEALASTATEQLHASYNAKHMLVRLRVVDAPNVPSRDKDAPRSCNIVHLPKKSVVDTVMRPGYVAWLSAAAVCKSAARL